MDWFPVLSQAKSLVQAICCDKEGALQTQKNFVRQCPIVSQYVAVAHLIVGEEEEAEKIFKEGVGTISGVIDSVPVVGHVKGGIHYICGDEEGGHSAMKASSRSTVVMAGGAGGMLLAGPVGAVAGGIAAADVIDTTISIATDEPYGMIANISNVVENPKDPGKWVDAVGGIAMDGLAGYEAGQTVKNVVKEVDRIKTVERKVGRRDAKAVSRAAEKASKTPAKKSGGAKVTTVVELEGKTVGVGHNKQYRKALKQRDPFDGKLSKVQTLAAENGVTEPAPLKKQHPRSCAEQQAHQSVPTEDIPNTTHATVEYWKTSGEIVGKVSCENCVHYKPGMGRCLTDNLGGVPIPLPSDLTNCVGRQALKCAGCGCLMKPRRAGKREKKRD